MLFLKPIPKSNQSERKNKVPHHHTYQEVAHYNNKPFQSDSQGHAQGNDDGKDTKDDKKTDMSTRGRKRGVGARDQSRSHQFTQARVAAGQEVIGGSI